MCFLFAPISAGGSFFLLHISHRLLSSSAGPASSVLLKLKNVNYRYRASAIAEAKVALTEYLHSTRALPFSLAEHIASNSPLSLISFVSQIPFNDATPTHFPRILRSFLSYRPVNEFEFFFESIGLPPSHPSLPSRSPLFLSDDKCLLDAVSSLLRFGFPWKLLGILYVECPSIFSYAPNYLLQRLHRFESLGFHRLCVIAICLSFPSTLSADVDDVELRLLFQDLRIILVEYGLDSRAGDDVHVLFRYCRRIRVFYDMGLEKGKMGELMGRNMRIFLDFDESTIAHKLGFFLKLGMRKEDVGPLALKNAEVFDVDLDNQIIVMPDHLLCVGLSKEETDSLTKKFPHVMGKNNLGNLPALIRALDLRQWLLNKIEEEKNLHLLLRSYDHSDSVSNKMEIEFERYLDSLKLVKQCIFLDAKVDFFS
ncbi:hypothetical protein HPP92_006119 [Vanilla planifolia]|uniref:Uncharacterized protein n=1 Tax=Vanilla planifolia TaxID=51239 RepID=A0A835RPZ8_VANPL|nr:hypothetical protein HPP92_006119 [Vanilla planifolia]